ncbi:hypothetical protein LguiA_017290 [Lonicera macranthoides]
MGGTLGNRLCDLWVRAGSGYKILIKIKLLKYSNQLKKARMGNPHVLVLPYPAQGHVLPLMELAQSLAKRGLKVSFVNTEVIHKRIVGGLSEDVAAFGDDFHMVTIADGLEPEEDRAAPGKLYESINRSMPLKLEELIREMNTTEKDNKITCLIADTALGWAQEVAMKMGIQRVAFNASAAAMAALGFTIPKLIEDGIINQDGTPVKKQMLELAPNMPIMNSADFVWARMGSLGMQKIIFRDMVKNNTRVKLAEWLICNSTYELEAGAFDLAPHIVPIGPLLASNRLGNSSGYFWPEDSSCLTWLDQQPDRSVMYVAFGSTGVFNKTQFEELAMGLELTNRPFLWVVRPSVENEANEAYPEGFLERVAARGKMVSWVAQQKVLSHRSIACFMSHCGWNSTVEGICNGVPFLCWPYFADQFTNETYICDVWKVGLGFKKDEKGIITREEILNKAERLLGDHEFAERASNFKGTITSSIKEGGSTYENLSNFVEWIKAGKS